jgi:hypothetical protein
MKNTGKNDPFEAWNENAHARDLEQNDQFNRLTDDTIPIRGGLRTKLEELAASGTREVTAILKENGIDDPRIHRTFYLSNGEAGIYFADDAGWHAQIQQDGQTLTFTASTKDDCMAAAERHANRLRGPRELTPAERLKVARIAQSGDTAEAASLDVALRLDRMPPRSAEEVLTDPALASMLNEVAVEIFRFTRPEYIFDQSFEDTLAKAGEIRPLTVNNVDFLFDRWQEQSSRSTRRAIQADTSENQPEPTQEDIIAELESLPDSALDKLRTQTQRHRAQLVRKFDTDVLGR